MTIFDAKRQRKGATRKLARLSAKGRRRENRAQVVVLFLLFLFVGAIISWISIAKRTEREQQFDAYGEWKAAFYDGDEARVEAFVNNPLTTRSGVSKLLGSAAGSGAKEKMEELKEIIAGDPSVANLSFQEQLQLCMRIYNERDYNSYFRICGSIGSLDESFVELGRVSMEEGRLPEATDEIAMTRSMLLRLGYGEELGQEIYLEVIAGNQAQVVSGTWRLSGILSPYGTTWKTKGYSLVSAVITEEAVADFPWTPSFHVFADVDGTVENTRYIYKISEEPMDVISHFAFNDEAYDFWGQTDYTYIWIVLLIVILTAAVTFFQIMTVQVRKRSRQVGLLKAIGATNTQVRRIFLREITGILWKTALFGTVSGITLVPLLLWGSGLAGKQRLYYGMNVPLLLGAVLLCCLVILLGAMVPVFKGSKIPIRGEILPKAVRLRPMKRKKSYSAGKIAAGRGSGGFRVAIVLFLAATASFVLLASYQVTKEMTPYRNREKRLRYRVSFNSNMQLEQDAVDNTLLEQFLRIPGVEAVYTKKNNLYQPGDFYISYGGVEECELEQMRKNWDISSYYNVYNQPYKKKDDRALVHLMGLYGGWAPNMEGLSDLVTEGDFDREAFEAGEEVLLFLPPYREMDNRAVKPDRTINKVEFNADKRYRDFYDTETCVKPGDTITLIVSEQVVDTSENEGEAWEQDPKFLYNGTREIPVKVGGIIRYLPKDTENVLWNKGYAGSGYDEDVLQLYTVVADVSLVNGLRGMHDEMVTECELENPQAGTGFVFGKGTDTLFDSIEILCDTSASESTQSGIENLAEVYGLYVEPPENGGGKTAYELWKTGYQEVFNRSLIYLMAAMAGVFVFVCLLLQNVNERLMEDRRRLGIFQAMGVGKEEVSRGYVGKGVGNGILALLAAHGVLAFAAVWQEREAVASLSPYRFISGREAFLYRFDLWFGAYDWKWHVLVCTLILAFSTALYVMPLRGILKNSPVENIRELGE
ncbi:MAG: hypothetical protein HFI67_01415 [Lachnospiraceae bacterium]|nr:hypothetical protein [Lachnospiraceae bacterium]